MAISQADIDDTIPALNDVVLTSKMMNPAAPLRAFPDNRRVIFLKKRKELEKLLKHDLENTTAFYHNEGGKIYVVQDHIEDALQNFDKQDIFGHLVRNRLALLNILNHENCHRSCKCVTESDHMRYFYLQLAKKMYKGYALKQLGQAEKYKGKMYTRGLNVEFTHPKGKMDIGKDDINEFAISYISSMVLSFWLFAKGYVPEIGTPFIELFMQQADRLLVQQEKNELIDKSLLDENLFKLFMADFLSGRISKILSEKAKWGIELDTILKGYMAQITGDMKYFPDMIKALYGIVEPESGK